MRPCWFSSCLLVRIVLVISYTIRIWVNKMWQENIFGWIMVSTKQNYVKAILIYSTLPMPQQSPWHRWYQATCHHDRYLNLVTVSGDLYLAYNALLTHTNVLRIIWRASSPWIISLSVFSPTPINSALWYKFSILWMIYVVLCTSTVCISFHNLPPIVFYAALRLPDGKVIAQPQRISVAEMGAGASASLEGSRWWYWANLLSIITRQ